MYVMYCNGMIRMDKKCVNRIVKHLPVHAYVVARAGRRSGLIEFSIVWSDRHHITRPYKWERRVDSQYAKVGVRVELKKILDHAVLYICPRQSPRSVPALRRVNIIS
jgi:hypothetical protein